MRVVGLIGSLVFVAGCFDAPSPQGRLCTASGGCPAGYACGPDQRCHRTCSIDDDCGGPTTMLIARQEVCIGGICTEGQLDAGPADADAGVGPGSDAGFSPDAFTAKDATSGIDASDAGTKDATAGSDASATDALDASPSDSGASRDASPADVGVAPGTLLLLHFDGDPNGAGGQTPLAVTGAPRFVPGVVHQAACFSASDYMRYASSGAITARSGSIEFWISPGWNGNDGQNHVVLVWGGGGGMLLVKDAASTWRIILNRFGGSGQHETGVGLGVNAWVPHHWHHAAFTWNAAEIDAYLDGALVATTAVDIQLPNIPDTSFQLADEGTGTPCDCVLDELRTASRALTLAEIRADYLAAGTASTAVTTCP